MQNIQTKSLVEAGVLSAISVVIAIIIHFIPVLSIFGLVWPVPFTILSIRQGFKWGVLSFIVSFLVMSFIITLLPSIYLALGLGISGVVLGGLLHKQVRPIYALLMAAFFQTISTVFTFILSFYFMGIKADSFIDTLFNVEQSTALAIELNKLVGSTFLNPDDLLKSIEIMRVILPTAVVFAAILIVGVNFYITKILAKRLDFYVPNFPAFKMWALPEKYAWICFLFMLIHFISNFFPNEIVRQITFNFYNILVIPLVVQSLSVFWYIAEEKGWPKIYKFLVVAFVFMIPVASVVLFLFGITDCFFDYRKIRS